MAPKRTQLIGIRIPDHIRDLLEEVAANETRTRSGQVYRYIRQGLTADGYDLAEYDAKASINTKTQE